MLSNDDLKEPKLKFYDEINKKSIVYRDWINLINFSNNVIVPAITLTEKC